MTYTHTDSTDKAAMHTQLCQNLFGSFVRHKLIREYLCCGVIIIVEHFGTDNVRQFYVGAQCSNLTGKLPHNYDCFIKLSGRWNVWVCGACRSAWALWRVKITTCHEPNEHGRENDLSQCGNRRKSKHFSLIHKWHVPSVRKNVFRRNEKFFLACVCVSVYISMRATAV